MTKEKPWKSLGISTLYLHFDLLTRRLSWDRHKYCTDSVLIYPLLHSWLTALPLEQCVLCFGCATHEDATQPLSRENRKPTLGIF